MGSLLASMAAGCDEFRSYIEKTLRRLEKSSSIDAAVLKGHVIPQIVASIKRLSAGASAAMRERFKSMLASAGVLPNYDADMAGLKKALQQILAMLPADKSETKEEAEEEAAGDVGAHPAIGGIGVEQQYKVVCMPESMGAANEEDAGDLPMLGVMGEEQQYRVTCMPESQAADNGKEEEEAVKERQEVAAPGRQGAIPASGEGAAQKGAPPPGRVQMQRYVQATLQRLETTSMPEGEVIEKVLPQVLRSLRGFASAAPVDMQAAAMRILKENQLLMRMPCVDELDEHPLQAQVRLQRALSQLDICLQRLQSGGEQDPYAVGLASPVKVQLESVSGDPVACFQVEHGTTAGALRGLAASFLDRRVETISFAQGDECLSDSAVFIEDGAVTLVKRSVACLAGVYLGNGGMCGLLALYPNGQTAAMETPDLNASIPDIVMNSELSQQRTPPPGQDWLDGAWTESSSSSGRVVSGSVYHLSRDQRMTFEFTVYGDLAGSEDRSDLSLHGDLTIFWSRERRPEGASTAHWWSSCESRPEAFGRLASRDHLDFMMAFPAQD